jgi:phospholipid/cholesterol/gamma-HCH transport system permease protein
MDFIEWIGRVTLARCSGVFSLAAVAWTVAVRALNPRQWPRTVRDVLSRQVLFTGIEAMRFISILAVALSVSIVAQVNLWATKLGQSQLLGPVLVTVVIRELGPLLTNFMVIARSGTAVAAELGQMQVAGEVRALDAQGLDPFTYLVVPRVVGMVISVSGLTVLFCAVTLVAGYLFGLMMGAPLGPAVLYFQGIVGDLDGRDVINISVKTVLPALLSGCICCIEGLGVSESITQVPQASTRALQKSVICLFILSAAVSAASYL